MLKKLLGNKKVLILIVAVVLVLVGIFITVFNGEDSKEKGGPDIGIELNKDKDGESLGTDTESFYNGDGLEGQDTLDESVYTIDGSGNWDGTSEESNKTETVPSDDTQYEDAEQGDSSDKDNNVEGDLEGDILVDDKKWGEIS